MKIAICIPVHGDTKAGFTRSLFGLALASAGSHELKLFMGRGTLFPHIRNDIADAALGWGTEWLLWLDADHTFPSDTLSRLLEQRRTIVGCNYPRRRREAAFPTAVSLGQHVFTTREKASAFKVEEVDTLGLGICLIRADVFHDLKRPYFRLAYDASGDFETEDVTFFRAAKAAGFTPFVDHALSWEVGHIDEQILTNSGTGRDNAASTVLPPAGAQ